MPALVPQPGLGVGDLAHAGRHRERCCSAHGALDLGDHFGRMAGGTHPVQAGDLARAVDVQLQHADGIQLRGELAFEDALAVQAIQVRGRILPIGLGRGRCRGAR